jgi:hypothetical protein
VSKIRVASILLGEDGSRRKLLVFDNHVFDYEVDPKEFATALEFCGDSPEQLVALHADIRSHFLQCLGEMLEMEITPSELLKAVRTGELDRKGEKK